jgi:hypothetical protein
VPRGTTQSPDPSYDEVIANNFTLAPETCVSRIRYPPPHFQLLEMVKCVVHGRESPAFLVTYSEGKCKGDVAIFHPSNNTGQCQGHIFFPNRIPTNRWSLIFHRHSEPFDEVSDPSKGYIQMVKNFRSHSNLEDLSRCASIGYQDSQTVKFKLFIGDVRIGTWSLNFMTSPSIHVKAF